jgi:hypothetical protein
VAHRRPDWLLLGAPRSGTTTLSTFLDEHPGAYLAPGKELQFLDRREVSLDDVPAYLASFAGARRDQRAGEASPRYLSMRATPARVAMICPDARLAAICRDPTDRAYSHYWWRRLWNAEPRSFETAVREEMAGTVVPGAEYLWGGCYANHLDMWEAEFPADQMLVLLFDDLRREPTDVFARLCGHFAIDESFVPPSAGERINTTHDVRWPRMWKATLRWRKERRLGVASNAGSRGGVVRRTAAWIDSRNARPFSPPPLDDTMRAELDEWFREPTARLAVRLGRELPWGHEAAPPSSVGDTETVQLDDRRVGTE